MNKKVKWVGTLSTTERNHIGLIRVRQNNVNSEVLGFEIIDGNGEPYDLKNRKVLFCTYFDRFAPVEQYAEVIENGKIIYIMNEHDMQKPVRINFAYFKIMDEKDNLVDTTQNFSYDIMPSIESKCGDFGAYIIRLEEVLDAFLQINTDAKKELEQIIIDFNQQIIEQQQNFDLWFESIREILESVDPSGIVLNELVASRDNESDLNTRLERDKNELKHKIDSEITRSETSESILLKRDNSFRRIGFFGLKTYSSQFKTSTMDDWVLTKGISLNSSNELTINESVGTHLNLAFFTGEQNAKVIEVTVGKEGIPGKIRPCFVYDYRNFSFVTYNAVEGQGVKTTTLQRITNSEVDIINAGPAATIEYGEFIAKPGDRIKVVRNGQVIVTYLNGVFKSLIYPRDVFGYVLPENENIFGGINFRDSTDTSKYSISKMSVTGGLNEGLMHFTLDDVIEPLRDLSENDYTSIFDQPSFAWLKHLNEKYGFVVTLQLFSESTDWDLSQMTDKYADEFRRNSNWLRFAFHARNDTIDYSVTTKEVAFNDYSKFTREVKRFASSYNIDNMPRISMFKCSKDAALGFKQAGARGFLTADDSRTQDYYLTGHVKEAVDMSDDFFDSETGLSFSKSDVRLELMSEGAEKYLNRTLDDYKYIGRRKVRNIFTHTPSLLDPLIKVRLEECLKWAVLNDFSFDFTESIIVDESDWM